MFFSWTVFSGTSVLAGEFMVTLHSWLHQGIWFFSLGRQGTEVPGFDREMRNREAVSVSLYVLDSDRYWIVLLFHL